MILDKEEDRKILLELINLTNFPGIILERILKLKMAITKAEVKENNKE